MNSLISNNQIQNAYNDLYSLLRQYIWGYEVVEAIADLEVACYQTCPDLPNIRQLLKKLKTLAILDEKDEDLDACFSEFEDLLNESDEYYVKLVNVGEIL